MSPYRVLPTLAPSPRWIHRRAFRLAVRAAAFAPTLLFVAMIELDCNLWVLAFVAPMCLSFVIALASPLVRYASTTMLCVTLAQRRAQRHPRAMDRPWLRYKDDVSHRWSGAG